MTREEEEAEIRITVRFFPALKQITRAEEMEVRMPKNANLKDLIKHLSDRFGEGFLESLYISDLGVSNPYTSVILDGKPVLLSGSSDIRLRDGSLVVFLSPIGGG